MKVRKILLSVLCLWGIAFPCLSQAMYYPGVLKYHVDISLPPSQEDVSISYWKMEEGIELFHFEHGRGTPILVIHGGPGVPPQKAWEGLLSLNDSYRSYYYHQRGCGKSSRPVERFQSTSFYENMQILDRKLGMEAQLMDIERIRRILGVEKMIVIGHSYGGFLATLYAVEFPDNLEKLILVSPAGLLRFPPEKDGMNAVREYLKGPQQEEFDQFLSSYFDYSTIFRKDEKELAELNRQYNLFYLLALGEKGIPVPKGADSTEGNGGWSVHALYLSVGEHYDYRPLLQKVTIPVLIIHGAQDIYSTEISREYASLFPQGKLTVMESAGHFSFDEMPQEFAREVKSFLEQ